MVETVFALDVRIAVSLLVVLVGCLLAGGSRASVRLTEEFLRQHAQREDHIVGGVPVALVPTTHISYVLQVAIVFEVVLVLLAIWGFGNTVEHAVDLLLRSVPLLVKTGGTVVIIGGSVFAIKSTKDRVRNLSEEVHRLGEHEQSVLLRVVHLLIFIAAGIALLSLWQFDLGSLLLGAGFLGVILGMGARQLLSSMLAGFVLMFSRPFEVGDWIAVGDVEGTATDITIMHTHLRSFDGETVVLPNDEVQSSMVTNRSDQGRLRLQLDIGIDMQTDFERAESIALEAIQDVDNVLDAPSPKVVGFEFSDSALVLRLWFWIDNPSVHRKWQTRTAVLQSVKSAFEDAGVEIPYPQREFRQKEVPAET